MQDDAKKNRPSEPTRFRVIGYEEIPLDKVEGIERPSSDDFMFSSAERSSGNTIPYGVSPDANFGGSNRCPTLPFSGTCEPPAPVVSGIRMNALDPVQVEETRQNAERASREITQVVRLAKLPSLGSLFDDNDEIERLVEDSAAFQGLAPVRSEVGQHARTTVELSFEINNYQPASEVDVIVPSEPVVEKPVRPSVKPANSAYEEVLAPDMAPAPIEMTNLAARTKREAKAPLSVSQKPLAETHETLIETSVPNAPSQTPTSRWGSWRGISQRISEKVSAAKSAITSFVKKHKTGVTLAAATTVAASVGSGLYGHQSRYADQQNMTDRTQQTVSSNKPEVLKSAPEKPKIVEAPVKEKIESEQVTPRKFGKTITESKSPMVQSIVQKGQANLNGSILGNTMLLPFAGLANTAQKGEIAKLQASINLGMGVFFNEHFGTAEKTAASLKDPNFRTLHSTAKVMKEKGWAPHTLTKDKYPEEYQLALRILADSHSLGLDQSSNPDPKVQARVNGNMFQAKINGDRLQLQKGDGSYHVVLEAVFNIFDGQNARDAIQTSLSAGAESKVNSLPDTKEGSSGDQPKDNHEVGAEKLPTPPAPLHTLNLPKSAPSPVPDTAPADVDADMELDAEWDNIAEKMEKMAVAKKIFEKDQTLAVQMAAGLSSRELHGKLIGAVGEKVAELYPAADHDKVVGLVKRFGYIGFHLKGADKSTGECQVKVYGNFYKILREVLDKKLA